MSQTISKISFKNYKSFQEASIDLSPLSILVGANSTGKSALLKLLLLISQSIASGTPSLFFPNGPLVEMGEKFSVFPRYDKSVEMEFRFFYSKRISLSSVMQSFYTAVRMSVRRELYALSVNEDLRKQISDLRARLMTSDQDLDALGAAAFLLEKHAEKVEEIDGEEDDGSLLKNFKGLGFAARIGQTLSSASADSISYKVRFNKKNEAPAIAKVTVLDGDQELMHYRPGDHKNMGPRLNIRGIDPQLLARYNSPVRHAVRSRSFRFTRRPPKPGMLPSQSNLVNPVGFLFGAILGHLSAPISETFTEGRVRHVSPLRAYPRRYYLLDGRDYQKAETERVISLLREQPEVVEEVNQWLGHLGQSVELEQLHDSIFRIMVSDGELNSDLTDVGFGLSQILPVILEPIIAKPNDLIVIQQPEIHLHPKAQSILADFFVWAVNEKGCKLIIETHSEYMLRRLRRRIGEGIFAPSIPTSIGREAVALMSIEKAGGVSVINKLELNEVGDFKWPRDFLDDEVDDLLAFVDLTATKMPKKSPGDNK